MQDKALKKPETLVNNSRLGCFFAALVLLRSALGRPERSGFSG